MRFSNCNSLAVGLDHFGKVIIETNQIIFASKQLLDLTKNLILALCHDCQIAAGCHLS